MTPQLETPHVLVRGSIKTGPVHRVLLESGAAQRAMAKVLRGLPDPVKVRATHKGDFDLEFFPLDDNKVMLFEPRLHVACGNT